MIFRPAVTFSSHERCQRRLKTVVAFSDLGLVSSPPTPANQSLQLPGRPSHGGGGLLAVPPSAALCSPRSYHSWCDGASLPAARS